MVFAVLANPNASGAVGAGPDASSLDTSAVAVAADAMGIENFAAKCARMVSCKIHAAGQCMSLTNKPNEQVWVHELLTASKAFSMECQAMAGASLAKALFRPPIT